MELITLTIIAAAGISGVIAAGVVARRRQAEDDDQPPALPEAEEPEEDEDPCEGLALGLGHVLQMGNATRWPRAGVVVHHDGQPHAVLLTTEEGGREQATMAMAKPSQTLYWLERRDLAMPAKPPTRLEVDGLLLDRVISFPARLEPIGEGPPDTGDGGQFCLYEGSVGDAAVVLIARETLVWYGHKLGADDWDDLGEVEP